LSIWLTAYSVLALGHFGHIHLYGRADPGFCTSACHNPLHHNVKPQCKGFPINLTLGVDAHPEVIADQIPVFQPAWLNVFSLETWQQALTDHSRAPPRS